MGRGESCNQPITLISGAQIINLAYLLLNIDDWSSQIVLEDWDAHIHWPSSPSIRCSILLRRKTLMRDSGAFCYLLCSRPTNFNCLLSAYIQRMVGVDYQSVWTKFKISHACLLDTYYWWCCLFKRWAWICFYFRNPWYHCLNWWLAHLLAMTAAC